MFKILCVAVIAVTLATHTFGISNQFYGNRGLDKAREPETKRLGAGGLKQNSSIGGATVPIFEEVYDSDAAESVNHHEIRPKPTVDDSKDIEVSESKYDFSAGKVFSQAGRKEAAADKDTDHKKMSHDNKRTFSSKDKNKKKDEDKSDDGEQDEQVARQDEESGAVDLKSTAILCYLLTLVHCVPIIIDYIKDRLADDLPSALGDLDASFEIPLSDESN